MEDEISDALGESDEVLDRLNQIKNAKVITNETYENIDKQVANQMYPGPNPMLKKKLKVRVQFPLVQRISTKIQTVSLWIWTNWNLIMMMTIIIQ